MENPPVLLDIGASGEMYQPWKDIAKYSICIAFDADAREIKYIENGSGGYKKMYIYNKIVTASDGQEENFYLTESPYCSSLLEPNMESLSEWSFSDLFKVEKIERLNTINLNRVLEELNIKQIDWFKTDSQGTDLRLFSGLQPGMINKILAADFEPGIINAYHNEDKFEKLLLYMNTLPFWAEEIKLPKTVRINNDTKKLLVKKYGERITNNLNIILKSSPFCAEISFLNNFRSNSDFSLRDHLLIWTLAYIKKQYAFALKISSAGKEKFNDPIFDEMQNTIFNEIDKKIRLAGLKKNFFILINYLKKLR